MWFQTWLAYNNLLSPLSIRRGKKLCIIDHTGFKICRTFLKLTLNLVHPSDQPVDLVLPVASVTSLHKVCGLLVHAATWRRQLEWPQEVVGGLEVLANCVDLMNEVLNADDAIFTCSTTYMFQSSSFHR